MCITAWAFIDCENGNKFEKIQIAGEILTGVDIFKNHHTINMVQSRSIKNESNKRFLWGI